MPNDDLDAWFSSPEVRALPLTEFVAALGPRLGALGVPIWRISCSVLTKHPELFGENCLWTVGAGATVRRFSHSDLAAPFFTASPAWAVYGKEVEEIRVRLARPEDAARYPITRELSEQGGTDYWLAGLPFSDGSVSIFSAATRHESGFSEASIEMLRRHRHKIAAVVELRSSYLAMDGLLSTYLGRNAARRVMNGAFRRGQGELIDALIWSCDLRGFTTRADQQPVEQVLHDLDAYFELVTAPIHDAGGEVLKFVGDAVLAVFPVGEVDRREACAAAFDAACRAIEEGAAHNARRRSEGKSLIEFGIGLHLGEVMYGNIGTPERLDFTVIGAAVNETCRIESLCKELGEPLVLSRAVAEELDGRLVRSLGSRRLRGVAEPVELFGRVG